MKCFSEIPGDTVTVGDVLGLDPTNSTTQTIAKDQFQEAKNDHLDLEPFQECKECGRKNHQICVLHLDSIWPEGYVYYKFNVNCSFIYFFIQFYL